MSTITFTCYACNQTLKVGADKAGRKAKCVQCGTLLTIPVASGEQAVKAAPSARPSAAPSPKPSAVPPPPPPAPSRRDSRNDFDFEERPRRRDRDDDDRPRRRRDEEDDYDRPRRRRRDEEDDDDRPRRRDRDDDDDYDDEPKEDKRAVKRQRRAVGVGFTLYWWRFLCQVMIICVFLVVIALTFIAGTLLTRGEVLTVMGVLTGIFVIVALVMLCVASPILAIIGSCFLLRAPRKTGGRGLAVALLILESAIVLCMISTVLFAGLAGIGPRRGDFGAAQTNAVLALVMYITMILCYVAAFVMLMVLVRFVAQYLKDRTAASNAINLMILYIVMPFSGAVLTIVITLIVGAITKSELAARLVF